MSVTFKSGLTLLLDDISNKITSFCGIVLAKLISSRIAVFICVQRSHSLLVITSRF